MLVKKISEKNSKKVKKISEKNPKKENCLKKYNVLDKKYGFVFDSSFLPYLYCRQTVHLKGGLLTYHTLEVDREIPAKKGVKSVRKCSYIRLEYLPTGFDR